MHDYEEIFRESFKRALGNSSYNRDFIGRFYEIFLSKSDRIAEHFKNTDMSAQKTMLHDSLHLMVEFYSSRKTNKYMERVAKVHNHAHRDIPTDMYEVWLDSLIESVKEFDVEFDDHVELSWRLVLAPGITYMKYMRDKP